MTRYTFAGGPSDFAVDLGSSDNTVKLRADAALTVWDSQVGGTQLTDLQTAAGDPVSQIVSDSSGRIPRFLGPDGVRSLWLDTGVGDRYLLLTSDLVQLLDSKQSATDPPGHHIHSPLDVPGITQQVGAALAYAFFDTEHNQWPARPDTEGPVVWIGDAQRPAEDVARWGLDYVDQHAVDGSTNIPDPTDPPEPGVPNADGIAMYLPVRSGTGAEVTLTADLASTGAISLANVQIAVRGPGGQIADVGQVTGVNMNQSTLRLSGSFTATAAGSWRAFIVYNKTGGNAPTDWVGGPIASFTVTLPTPGGGNDFPQAGRSGLDWNSGIFPSSAQGAQWEQSSVAAAGTYRGRLSDTMLVFAQRNTGWGGAGNPFGLLSWYDGWTSFPGILILTVPPQPQGQDNTATAAGQNNARWRDFGALVASKGRNTQSTVLRLGHECNGNWYDWSWHKNGGPQAYIAAFKNVVTSFRAGGATNVTIDLCLNKDWTHPSMTWQAVLTELRDYFDVVGLDAYDMYDGWRNDAARRTAWYNNPGPQRNSVASWCRSNGKLMSLDEWGLVAQASAGSDGTGGGDDTLYITDTWTWCQQNADVLAWESYYNHEGAPPDLEHTLSNYASAEAAYLSGSRWGD